MEHNWMDRNILTEALAVAMNHKLTEVSNVIVRLHLALGQHVESIKICSLEENICLEVCT